MLPRVNQILTLNSQKSDIDVFSRLQVNFLEKFFKYNLNDYLSDTLVNLYEDALQRKVANKVDKVMSAAFFRSVRNFYVEDLEQRVEKFYRTKSKSMEQGDLPYCFKLKYCSCTPTPNFIKAGELIFFEVKLKAEVQKIEQFPQKIIQSLQSMKPSKKSKLSEFQKILSNYKEEYFTIMIAYFGDTNFNIFRKDRYQVQKIKIMGRVFKLRIFVFYISKQSLLETFKVVNKIQNLEYINDLVIQFYELKREKQKARKKKDQIQARKQNDNDYKEVIYKIAGICGLVTVGYALKKFLVE